uniref:BAG family molecular chaperone regulator 1-like n=1 Tax=Saccoglossus kowalevskii TaxID=10224 RepID=A0ABM0LVM9_SACKO|nr:PREDICTED: BAG family molecular chaperone regulator 1-like [Saccoglossus kowalevskii]
MDASTQKLSVTLIHGSVKHKLDVTKFDESCDELIVLDVLESAKVLTGVPIHAQKLICKGKSLSDPHQTLKDAGVKAGCKVMMIGKKTNPEEETNIKMIADEEKKTRNSEKNQNEIISEVDGIEKGFLEDGLIRQACGQLLKKTCTMS